MGAGLGGFFESKKYQLPPAKRRRSTIKPVTRGAILFLVPGGGNGFRFDNSIFLFQIF
jgi:hypothetical protein